MTSAYFCTIVVNTLKIPNISPGLIEVRKHFWGGLHSVGLIFGGSFCVSTCTSKTLKSITITIKCPYYRQKRYLFKPKSPSFCFKIYLKLPQYLFHLMTIDLSLLVLEGLRSRAWNSVLTLFLGGFY